MQTWCEKTDCRNQVRSKLNMENINSWNEIKWTLVHQTVFRLQLRIYRAATEKRLEKMYKLQKTLISSKFAKYLAVLRVTQDNTLGISSPKEKFEMANKLLLKGTSSHLVYPSGKRNPEDRAKQMLAYLALCPQWEAHFESPRYRPNNLQTERDYKQDYIPLITLSNESTQAHRLKVRAIIRQSRGVDQENLIKKLNPIILRWALAKRSQIASKIFQHLDAYLWFHLWKWGRKRHPKMSKIKLKEKYWHKVGKKNWVFGVKDKKGNFSLRLQLHSKIHIKLRDEGLLYGEKTSKEKPKFRRKTNNKYLINCLFS